MTNAERGMADGLNRYLDGLAGGDASRIEPRIVDLDPSLARTAEYLNIRDNTPGADPVFADKLLNDIVVNAGYLRARPSLPSGESVQTLPSPSRPSARPGAPARQRWPFAHLALTYLATAALLLVTIASTFLFFGPVRRQWSSEQPGIALTGIPDSSVRIDAARLLWDSQGDPDRPLDHPAALAIDPDGRIWVADTLNHGYQIVSSDGAYLESWGAPGAGPGEFNFQPEAGSSVQPMGSCVAGGIAFAPDGSFYIADSGNARVQMFGPDRAPLLDWGSKGTGEGQFIWPSGVAIDRAGHVYIADAGRNDVQVFSADGEYLWTIGTFGTRDGELYLWCGAYLAINGDGNLWVSDTSNHRLQEFSTEGEFLATIGSAGIAQGQFSGPGQVAIDADGRLFVADRTSSRVQIFDGDGTYLASIGDEEGNPVIFPAGAALDGAGGLYVSDFFEDRVLKYQLPPSLTSERPGP
jgi:DNA-binding beta-propeller fold protein YncE